MKFCTMTLGCKVNQSETQAIEVLLTSRGHTRAELGAGCDVCIVNTCAVTSESVRKSRQAIRRVKRLEPGALIAVCGCLSQLEPDATAAIGADFVGGSGGRRAFALEIEKFFIEREDRGEQRAESGEQGEAQGKKRAERKEAKPGLFPVYRVDNPVERRVFEEIFPLGEAEEVSGAAHGGGQRTRALLKIQDGCDNYCAFCIVPHVRGRVRSLPIERAADLARELDERGYREIVVTGIEISSYGKDLYGKTSLQDVLQAISDAAPRARLRLGSLDPGALSADFCDSLRATPNLCGHFHLSLQSGCDETLRRMGRTYDTVIVGNAIAALRERFTGCGITADLIAGFPGETESEFEQTLAFIKGMAFSGMHIFPFSPRPGTPAADMPGQIAKGVRRERARIATAAAQDLMHVFKIGQVGKTVEVLFERKRGDHWTGHSGNYTEIAAINGGARNSVHNVRITSVVDGIVWGEIV